MSVDLHMHSLFSVDGFATPEELMEAKAAEGLAAVALTDHNCIDGLSRARAAAARLRLKFITGAEFDVMWHGNEQHMLAFGFDPTDQVLARLCARNFRQYTLNFARFLPILAKRYGVSAQTLSAGLPAQYRTHPSPVLNKWFARDYMTKTHTFSDPQDALHRMHEVATEAEQGIEHPWDWLEMKTVRDAVHAAGGILLVAHPGNYLRGSLKERFKFVESLLAEGLDGFELFHPAIAAEKHLDELVAETKRLGCALSGGTDTHYDNTRPFQAAPDFLVPDWVLETIDAALARRRSA